MKLFVTAFALSAVLTIASSFVQAQDGDRNVGSPQPMSHYRFQMTPSQSYLISKAREESAHRDAMIHNLEYAGFNFGQPEINSGMFWTASPPPRYRRFYFSPNYGYQTSTYMNTLGY